MLKKGGFEIKLNNRSTRVAVCPDDQSEPQIFYSSSTSYYLAVEKISEENTVKA